MWAEETEQECGLCVVVLLPGIDAAAQRVDVAEAVGAEWVFIGNELKGRPADSFHATWSG
ncbi:hypothetical protein GCM10009604_20560 [Corynebacterium aurimucosum]|uniref:hypothetical protein n=1 Tax=Corynebacterium aurimucosum TaxID=169292 RepID=UPI00191D3901|nr:hypothetical protein [Corynebacterium aurimucosum]QQU95980.1 hypothetical protein I6I66_02360 [Corynebacterium aurimucosum]